MFDSRETISIESPTQKIKEKTKKFDINHYKSTNFLFENSSGSAEKLGIEKIPFRQKLFLTRKPT
jgi:hypothetical protein